MKCHYFNMSWAKPTPQISIKQLTTPELCVNITHRIRVYNYSTGASLAYDFSVGDNLTIGFAGAGLETITETLLFQKGRASRSLFDEYGRKDIFDSSLQGLVFQNQSVIYTVPYSDYDVVSDAAGNKNILWYFDDGLGGYLSSVVYSCTYISCGCDAEHLDLCVSEATCTAAGGYWYSGACHDVLAPYCSLAHPELCLTQETCEAVSGLYWWSGACHNTTVPLKTITVESWDEKNGVHVAGDAVYLDGSYKGNTDSEGFLMITDVPLGTHTIKLVKSGIQDTDLDALSNDSIEVTA